MLKTNAVSYAEIRAYIGTLPVIDTHEHYAGETKPVEDIFKFIFDNYYKTDLFSAAFGKTNEVHGLIYDESMSFDDKYSLFEKYYRRSDKTAYARATLAGYSACWGIERFDKAGLLELQDKMKNRDARFYESCMEKYKIKAKIVDVIHPERLSAIIEGKDRAYSPYCRFAFTLPGFHNFTSCLQIYGVQKYMDKKIACLDDYLEGFEVFLVKAVNYGVICFKDQSAYFRMLNYENPPKAAAEQVFNRMLAQPRDTFSSEDVKPLDDWLFHFFMRLARKYSLPVQLHTGHMAGNYNDIRKTNAAHLIPLIELHSEVKFDLFHGNWPYMDEYLFLGKNYPNVYFDLCWAQIIDPLYCVELMKRAIVTAPHSKMMVYGGDEFAIEGSVGYLLAAQDNTACALSEMVECGWLDIKEAKQIAADWLFNNPNEFFGLGFQTLKGDGTDD